MVSLLQPVPWLRFDFCIRSPLHALLTRLCFIFVHRGLLPSSTASFPIVSQPLHVADSLHPLFHEPAVTWAPTGPSTASAITEATCLSFSSAALWTSRPPIQGPHGKGTGIFHLTRSPQIYKKLYNKCFFWRHLLRPRQLDLPLAILIRVSAVPWTPRPLQRVVVLSAPTPFLSTPVLQAWLCAVHRSMALAAVCACHRLASRGCAFHFRVPSAYTVRYILQPALRSLARLILS